MKRRTDNSTELECIYGCSMGGAPYRLPKIIHQPNTPINYWYGENERKDRRSDITYVKDAFKNVVFTENKGQDHAEFASLYPEEFCRKIEDIIT